MLNKKVIFEKSFKVGNLAKLPSLEGYQLPAGENSGRAVRGKSPEGVA